MMMMVMMMMMMMMMMLLMMIMMMIIVMIIIMKIDNEKKIHSLFSKSKEYASKRMHIFQAHAPNPANHLGSFKNNREVPNIGFQRSPCLNTSSTFGVGVGNLDGLLPIS